MDMESGHFSASDRYKYLKEKAFEQAVVLEKLGLHEVGKEVESSKLWKGFLSTREFWRWKIKDIVYRLFVCLLSCAVFIPQLKYDDVTRATL